MQPLHCSRLLQEIISNNQSNNQKCQSDQATITNNHTMIFKNNQITANKPQTIPKIGSIISVSFE